MKKKAGRKPLEGEKKIARTITMDADLPGAVGKVTRNLSGFLNDAGWEKLARLSKRHPNATRPTRESGK